MGPGRRGTSKPVMTFPTHEDPLPAPDDPPDIQRSHCVGRICARVNQKTQRYTNYACTSLGYKPISGLLASPLANPEIGGTLASASFLIYRGGEVLYILECSESKSNYGIGLPRACAYARALPRACAYARALPRACAYARALRYTHAQFDHVTSRRVWT
jgi:hypothetical protein